LGGFMTLDNIQFSTIAVPEANSFGLYSLGRLFVACCTGGKVCGRSN